MSHYITISYHVAKAFESEYAEEIMHITDGTACQDGVCAKKKKITAGRRIIWDAF